ncbi:MAG: hypothetical protein HQL51_05245 [Magnetococcales bacterium]|nr:hypothetical protein [Magnetococcales bacterium]
MSWKSPNAPPEWPSPPDAPGDPTVLHTSLAAHVGRMAPPPPLPVEPDAKPLTDQLPPLFSRVAEMLDVALIACWNPRQETRRILAAHPGRTPGALLRDVDSLMDSPLPRLRHWRQRDHLFHLWLGAPLDRWERLIVVENLPGRPVEETYALLKRVMREVYPGLPGDA